MPLGALVRSLSDAKKRHSLSGSKPEGYGYSRRPSISANNQSESYGDPRRSSMTLGLQQPVIHGNSRRSSVTATNQAEEYGHSRRSSISAPSKQTRRFSLSGKSKGPPMSNNPSIHRGPPLSNNPQIHHGSSSGKQRRHSVSGPSQDDLIAAYYRAKEEFEIEETRIMREEIRQRGQNDLECKRQMAMLERNKLKEMEKFDEDLADRREDLMDLYRAGKIRSKDLESKKARLTQKNDRQWNEYMDWFEDEQRRAQRIFFSRGEEICAEAGKGLRLARQKVERAKAAAGIR